MYTYAYEWSLEVKLKVKGKCVFRFLETQLTVNLLNIYQHCMGVLLSSYIC
jgi:hypothetical protein